MKYKLKTLLKAEKALEKIEPIFAKKIRDKIKSLGDDPRQNGCKKLSGFEKSYRVRVGKYRVIYEIYDDEILICVVNVDHRKDVYR